MVSKIVFATLHIEGMTCANCESRIERKLLSLFGVESAEANFGAGTVEVAFDAGATTLTAIKRCIESLDYKITKPSVAISGIPGTFQVLGVLIALFALYMILRAVGALNVFSMFPEAKAGMGYGMLFVIGLLTSLHCVAMCGGINLSQCAYGCQGGGKLRNLRSSLLYNLGRVVSYTVVGGIVGSIGSVVSFSGVARGAVQLLAGVFMIVMGLNMIGIFPWLRRLNPRMPKVFTKNIDAQKTSNGPFYIGLVNGLMPCGPLQAMQLYALSTGSPIKGALSMLLFSLGTVPLMFGLGALSSLLSSKFTHKMMAVSAVLVMILGVFMSQSGMSLLGIVMPSLSSTTKTAAQGQDVQRVTTKLAPNAYEPITVKAGIPVKWTIQADEKNINGCNNELLIPALNIDKNLQPGDNLIEFTPERSGTIPFSCWMGMIRSQINVTQ